MIDPAQLVAALLGGAAVLALIGWVTPVPRLATVLCVGLTGSAALVALLATEASVTGAEEVAVLAAGGLVAVAGGGPLTTVLFDLVDRPGTPREASVQRAGEVLRGGAWIGGLERLAAYATVVAGWPEGLAIVLAVKGLGRYPELRPDVRPDPAGALPADRAVPRRATAERFIIGTFTSVLWALAAAGVAVATIRATG